MLNKKQAQEAADEVDDWEAQISSWEDNDKLEQTDVNLQDTNQVFS